MKFRPCIDLQNGKVVQIVGGSIDETSSKMPVTNFESERSPAFYADMYKEDGLTGGHVISLGKGNYEAAVSALRAYPGGMQYGGGVNTENALEYIKAGASHVIITSYVFTGGRINMDRLNSIIKIVGKKRLVLDLSCRKKKDTFYVVTDRWQNFTDVPVNEKTLSEMAEYCDEFLVHGVDVEGKMSGIQCELVEILGNACPIAVTYAGGARNLKDLDLVNQIGKGRVDLTIGSALDIFGGNVPYRDIVNRYKKP
jgi:phosphoribosylformimino-5-aminoimidazole carboxamide ribotide isomerase